MPNRKRMKGHIIIYKTQHRQQKIEQHDFHFKMVVISDDPDGSSVPAPHISSLVLVI